MKQYDASRTASSIGAEFKGRIAVSKTVDGSSNLSAPANRKTELYVQLFQRVLQRACSQGVVAFIQPTAEFDDSCHGCFPSIRHNRAGDGPLL